MEEQRRIVLCPYLGIGHVKPMLVLAEQLAKLDFNITFVFPGKDLRDKAIGSRSSSNGNIRFDVVEMEKEVVERLTCPGLREQEMSNEEYMEAIEEVFSILGCIRLKIAELLRSECVSALILDPFLFYRGIVVDNLKLLSKSNSLKIFAFAPVSATSIFCFRYLMLNGFIPPAISLPGLSFELYEHDFPSTIIPGSGHLRAEMHADRNKWMDETCTGIILNTWEGIEQAPIQALSSTLPPGLKLYAVGPLFSIKEDYFSAKLTAPFGDWLDKQDASSVLYICFGSWLSLADEQLEEVAMGLESSGVPFLWVLGDAQSAARLSWLPGFVERIQGRALVHLGWAPQQFILGHAAVGGFLMTSGWNSVIEGLLLSPLGVSFVAWPLYLDHMPTCRLLVNGLRVAVEVKAEKNSNPYYGFVRRQDVEVAARSAMLGLEAQARRERAKFLGQVARRSASAGGTSTLQLHDFAAQLGNGSD